MAELTKQDIEVISTALHSWANQSPSMAEIESVAFKVLGSRPCGCSACTESRGGQSLSDLVSSHREQIEKEVNQLTTTRRERAAVVTAKLVAMRDSIVADQLFDSIGGQKF